MLYSNSAHKGKYYFSTDNKNQILFFYKKSKNIFHITYFANNLILFNENLIAIQCVFYLFRPLIAFFMLFLLKKR